MYSGRSRPRRTCCNIIFCYYRDTVLSLLLMIVYYFDSTFFIHRYSSSDDIFVLWRYERKLRFADIGIWKGLIVTFSDAFDHGLRTHKDKIPNSLQLKFKSQSKINRGGFWGVFFYMLKQNSKLEAHISLIF